MRRPMSAKEHPSREVPARILPVPETVSPQMQAVIARLLDPNFNTAPTTTAEWRERVENAARLVLAALPQLREALSVTVQPTALGGVKAFTVTPGDDAARKPQPRAAAFSWRRQGLVPRRIRDP